MEKINLIKKDIQEKSGKEWLGLQRQTEDRLDSLVWYLEHPKMQESPKLAEEIIELYYAAKVTNFMKMEGIIRKLDQLSIKFTKVGAVKKTGTAQSHTVKGEQVIYVKAIEELIKEVDEFLNSNSSISLPGKSRKSLITFINFLNHPKLLKKTALFDEMKDKYDKTKELDFISMQVFDDMLNMCEIKLGAISKEDKKYKSPEERKKEFNEAVKKFEAEKEMLQEELKNFEREKEEMKVEREKIETEKSKMSTELENLKIEQEKMEEERKKIEVEREKIETEKSNMATELENLWSQRKKMDEEQKKINEEQKKIEAEKEIIKKEEEKRPWKSSENE